ncbi:importin-4-like [Daphnia pulex]|uniref:importin-4-like n=1 Tax=Daphnia pulex TaxID=6669 RepID=UPI001EDEEDEA|nr:importin-4-like [Daphnia pulex]
MIEDELDVPILQTIFLVMTEVDGEEDEYDQVKSDKPCIVAAQTLHKLALHLPPDKVITFLLQWADLVFKDSDTRAQQAGYTALAVVVEGCAEHIRTEYMATFVQVICSGVKHPQAHVRNAALYAIEKFAQYLQPDIDKYANDILPILLEYLLATSNSLANGKKVPRSVERVFDTLEMFCDTMGAKLNPFVPALMEHLFIALNPTYPFLIKELALNAIGATGHLS